MTGASRSGPFTSTPVCSDEAERVSMRALWFGLAGAPVAWSINEVADAALVSHNCYPAAVPLSAPLVGALSAIVMVVSIVAIVVAVMALVTALRSWKAVREVPGNDAGGSLIGPPPGGRSRFMARAGIAVSVLFLGGIVLQTLAIAMVRPCAGLAP